MQTYYEFAQIIMIGFVPIFITSLIVAVPLSITRGRIVLRVLVGLGGLSLVALILLTLWAPMTLIGTYIIFPFLVPAFIAGFVILLMTGAKTSRSLILRAIVSVIIIASPFVIQKEIKKLASEDTKHTSTTESRSIDKKTL